MVQEGEGKIFSSGKAETLFVSIPSKITTDSTFPFEEGEEVEIRIEDGKLVVSPKDG